MSSDQQALQALTDEYQNTQKDLQNMIEARQRLDSQLSENEAVKTEFDTLDDTANIYKLIGPILVKQDKSEAVMNVDKRLEFIGNEIRRIETQLAEMQEQGEKKKIEIMQLQTKLQQGQPQTA